MTTVEPIAADAEATLGAVATERTGASPPRSTAADLVTLTKPRITLMVVVTMLGGIWLAVHRFGRSASPSTATLAIAVVGTALVVGSANALNMYLERFSDRLMACTKNQPLPAAVRGLLLLAGEREPPPVKHVLDLGGARVRPLVARVLDHVPTHRSHPGELSHQDAAPGVTQQRVLRHARDRGDVEDRHPAPLLVGINLP